VNSNNKKSEDTILIRGIFATNTNVIGVFNICQHNKKKNFHTNAKKNKK